MRFDFSQEISMKKLNLKLVELGLLLKFSSSEKAAKIWSNLPQGFDIAK